MNCWLYILANKTNSTVYIGVTLVHRRAHPAFVKGPLRAGTVQRSLRSVAALPRSG